LANACSKGCQPVPKQNNYFSADVFSITDKIKSRFTNIKEAESKVIKKLNTFEVKTLKVNQKLTKFSKKIEKETAILVNKSPKNEEESKQNEESFTNSVKSEIYEISIEIKELMLDYDDIKSASSIYFIEIDDILNNLRENSYYSTFKNDTDKVKSRYTQELNKAAIAINEMEQTYKDIENFDQVLELYTTLYSLEQQIDKLKNITSRAILVSKRLEEFSSQSRRLLEKNPSFSDEDSNI